MTPNNDVVLCDPPWIVTSNGSSDPSYLNLRSNTYTYLSTNSRTALISSFSCTHSTYVVRTPDMHAPAIVAARIVTIISLTHDYPTPIPFSKPWAVSFLIEETCLGQGHVCVQHVNWKSPNSQQTIECADGPRHGGSCRSLCGNYNFFYFYDQLHIEVLH